MPENEQEWKMPSSTRKISFDRILVADGAMGTMLHTKGVTIGSSFDEVNLSSPNVVEEIHSAYVDAGVDIIETNTFGANRIKLESYGLSTKVREINLAGAVLARRCARDRAFVAGAVGPIGRLMKPFGPMDFTEVFDVFREQISALCEGGVDMLIIETMQDIREAKAAILAAKTITEIPIVCQMSFSQEGRTMMGTGSDVSAVALAALGVTLVGANCSTGPADMIEVIENMSGVTNIGLSAQPNAGLPSLHDGRLIYLSTPEYMADYARRFVESGAVLVGGCCGTTPDHIRAIASAVSGMRPLVRSSASRMRVAGRSKLFEVGESPILIGNRLSVIHDDNLARDLNNGSFKLVQDIAEGQYRQGADIILVDCDVVPSHCQSKLVELVQTGAPAALCIAGSSMDVLESAVCAVEGRAILCLRAPVNVVVESLLPLARKYGAAVAVRTDVENGVGSPEERFNVAARIVEAAERTGLKRSDMVVHCGSIHTEGRMADTIGAIKLIRSELQVAVMADCASESGVACSDALRAAIGAGADLVMGDPGSAEIRSVFESLGVRQR